MGSGASVSDVKKVGDIEPSRVERDKREDAPSRVERDKREEAPSRVERDKREEAPSRVEREKREEAPSPVERDKREEAPSRVERDKKEDAPLERDKIEDAPSPVETDKREEAPSPVETDKREEAPSPVETDKREEAPSRVERDKIEDAELDDVPTPPGTTPPTASAESQEEYPPKPDAHTINLHESSVESMSENRADEDVVEKIEPNLNHTATEPVTENEEVPLAFESFLHNNGYLYSCFSQHGNKVYLDESQVLRPFPNDWYTQGRFITDTNEVSAQVPVSSQQVTSEPDLTEDGRAGGVYIQGRGTVMTYMFEEKANICRYFDAQSGLWLLLPLQWEMNIDFVKERVKLVMGALPGLFDQKEITAALRQCNYDPDEVISVYLTIFGDILLQSSTGEQNYPDVNSFRAHLKKDRVIEDLRQKLHNTEKEAENFSQKNSYLAREAHYLSDVVQHLNQRVAELEADRQEATEKIRALLNRRTPATPPAPKTAPKHTVDPAQLRQVRRFTWDLNVSSKQLRSTVRQALTDMQNQLEQLRGSVEKMTQAEREAGKEVEELRSLYRKEALERKALYNKLLELQGNVRVFCRCRGNSGPNTCLETTSDQELVVLQKGAKKKYLFDKIYPSSTSQEEVFEGTLPIIASCVDGYNVCILAYGQTGSGKTFTMMGTKDKPGVNIRSVRELLRICKEKENITYILKISMLEIYNEGLNDLLSKNPPSPLEIRAQGKSISVPGLTHVDVKTEDDILNIMEMGEKNRKIAATKMNIESSRSHLVVTLRLEGTDSVSGATSQGTLTLCDLAGSERISKTEAEGQRLVEAAAINKSLTSLGQVFSALKCNALHVPFRNSKLTHLLQPCLSGDAKCCVFVNVSPDVKNVVETLSTLQFGSSIRQVALGKASQHTTPAKSTKTDK